MPQKGDKKSVFWAYFLWLFGGVFGFHHFYLGRDLQAFVWWSTLGGFCGLGLLHDLFNIPKYVQEANFDPVFAQKLLQQYRVIYKPNFSSIRFIAMFTMGYLLSELYINAIPQKPIFEIDFSFLHWLTPLAATLGISLVGNIGLEEGSNVITFLTSLAAYQIRWFVADSSIWLPFTVIVGAFIFENYTKTWKKNVGQNNSLSRRLLKLSTYAVLYLLLWSSYLYFNGTITNSEGDEIPIHDAIKNFLNSPWWTDLKQSLHEIYIFYQHHGWYEIWKQIVDLSDLQGEQNAYKTLGVSPMASQTEIKSRWKQLSLEFHPDKVKDPESRLKSQEKFMEIQQAYELISKIKSKRSKRNKAFDDL